MTQQQELREAISKLGSFAITDDQRQELNRAPWEKRVLRSGAPYVWVEIRDKEHEKVATMVLDTQGVDVTRFRKDAKPEQYRFGEQITIPRDQGSENNETLLTFVKIILENLDKPLYAVGEHFGKTNGFHRDRQAADAGRH
jgi:hypothetical protein